MKKLWSISGGAAKAVGLFEAAKVCVERKDKPDIIIGTSSGALVAPIIAASYQYPELFEEAILCGWLRPYDILVCNNAAIYEKGYNCGLGHFLWDALGLDGEPLNILLLPLPTRSLELNPIELTWNIVVQRLHGVKRGMSGNHMVA